MFIEILYDHYKDTFENIKTKEKIRSTYFIASGIIAFLLILLMIHPDESITAISTVIKQETGADITNISPTVISALWISFLYIILRYYQVCINIERQYSYLHKLELHLADENALGEIFSREGSAYNNNYPKLSSLIYLLYTICFPIIYIVVIVIKLISEYKNLVSNNFVFDLIIGILIFILIVFYLLTRIKRK